MSNDKPTNGRRLPATPAPRARIRLASKRNGVTHNGHDAKPIVITGGAGFIGTNLAHRLLSEQKTVVLFDNLSRPGVTKNLRWLQKVHGDRVRHVRGDIRDAATLREVVSGASRVFHFAAQVAVTTSLENPIEDFEINALGTLNLLEALRSLSSPPSLVYTSTNKVYGDLKDVALSLRGGRYEPREEVVRRFGFNEQRPLNFHSPYGCSKGAACQYVLDYARTFGLPTVVFRMSCIYGPHQFGNEDQGWVAHFLIRALDDQPVTVFGDGCQVRDVLFVEDLVQALMLAQDHMDRLSGHAFNMGGGPENTISLRELLRMIRALHGKAPEVRRAKWRAADQQYYVSDTRKFSAMTGWAPQVGVSSGVERLYQWLKEFRGSAARPSRHKRRGAPVKTLLVASPRAPTAIRRKQVVKLRLLNRVNGAARRNGRMRKVASSSEN